jgi:hypothetical protein
MRWTSQDFLWLFTPSFELLIAVRVFQQGLWREYPLFWSYLLAEIFRAALLFGMGSATPHGISTHTGLPNALCVYSVGVLIKR